MTSPQMYELAKNAVLAIVNPQPEDENTPDVLWIGGVMEVRRAVVWCGDKLYMVTHNTNTNSTLVDTYVKQAQEEEST